MTLKRWAIPAAMAVVAALAIGVAFALASSGDGDDGSDTVRRGSDDGSAECGADGGEACDGAADCREPPCDDVGDGLAICIEGALDCNDTIEKPDNDVCIQIFPTPVECADPDTPVSNDPGTIIDPQAPDACNSGSNIEECQKRAIELAVVDLAERSQIDAEAITAVSADRDRGSGRRLRGGHHAGVQDHPRGERRELRVPHRRGDARRFGGVAVVAP